LVVDLIHAANNLCLESGIGGGSDGLHYRSSTAATERLGLTTRICEDVMCQMVGGVTELSGLFSQSLGR